MHRSMHLVFTQLALPSRHSVHSSSVWTVQAMVIAGVGWWEQKIGSNFRYRLLCTPIFTTSWSSASERFRNIRVKYYNGIIIILR